MDLDRRRVLPDLREPRRHLRTVVIRGVGHGGPQVLGCAQQVNARLAPRVRVPLTPILASLADIPQVHRDK
jgi:hypothetical protein